MPLFDYGFYISNIMLLIRKKLQPMFHLSISRYLPTPYWYIYIIIHVHYRHRVGIILYYSRQRIWRSPSAGQLFSCSGHDS